MTKTNEFQHVFGMRESHVAEEKNKLLEETKFTVCWRKYTIAFIVVVFVLSAACAIIPFYTFVTFRFAYPVLASGGVTYMGPAAWILMFSGLIAMILCVVLALVLYLGNPRAILIVYAAMIATALPLMVGGSLALWARNQYGWIPYQYDDKGETQLKYNYQQPGYSDWSYAMDATQQYFQCCAFRDQSWMVYQQSKWYEHQPGIYLYNKPCVPITCCRRDQFGNIYNSNQCQLNWNGAPCKMSSSKNEAVFYDGCSKYMFWIVDKFGMAFGIISIFDSVIMILSLAALVLGTLSRRDDD